MTATQDNYQLAAKQPQAIRRRSSSNKNANSSRRGMGRSKFLDHQPTPQLSMDEGSLVGRYHRASGRSVPDAANSHSTCALDFASDAPLKHTVRISTDDRLAFSMPSQTEDTNLLAAMYPTVVEGHGVGSGIHPIHNPYQQNVFTTNVPIYHGITMPEINGLYKRDQQTPSSWDVSCTLSPSPTGHPLNRNASHLFTSLEVDTLLPDSLFPSSDVLQSDWPMRSELGQYPRF